ncbi:MAG: substrate-binding domain-containing protein [Planctomycetota bacterium]|jgi:ribose transport system substrate-binding protein
MKQSRRSIGQWIGLFMTAMAVILGGCRKRADKPTVALVMKSPANEFFKTMEEGAKAHHAQHADEYELKVLGIRNETAVTQQIKHVELMMAQDVNAIVIAPADSEALVTVCKKAIDAGITVVNIDNRLDADVLADRGIRIPFVGPDNQEGAKLAGVYLATRLNPGDKVAIIEGAPDAYNDIQRKRGFEEAMLANNLNIVASQTGHEQADKARFIASALTDAHADLKGILCANDGMALEVVSALETAGKSGDIYVVGFGDIPAVRRLLKEGKVLCTVDQHADQLAAYGIQYALDILAGRTPAADKDKGKHTPVDLITAETL